MQWWPARGKARCAGARTSGQALFLQAQAQELYLAGPRFRVRGGLGLAAVTDRLARVGGTLSVAPNDDGGVTVHAWLPT